MFPEKNQNFFDNPAKFIVMHIDAIYSRIEKFARDFIFCRRFRRVRDSVTSYAPGNANVDGCATARIANSLSSLTQ